MNLRLSWREYRRKPADVLPPGAKSKDYAYEGSDVGFGASVEGDSTAFYQMDETSNKIIFDIVYTILDYENPPSLDPNFC